MFGTRADLFLDVVLVITLATPFVMWWSLRFTRRGRWRTHRAIQLVWLVVCFTTVIAFETKLRLAGGSGSFIASSPYAGPGLKALLLTHMSGAILTYLAWLVLAVLSLRRAARTLPGTFSRTHRRAGYAIFAGGIFNAVTAVFMYVFTFAL